jgi:uncharacterized protein (TIGR02271 family)
MTQFDDVSTLQGSTLYDRDGDKIGKIDEIYEDAHSGRPEWALVNTGLFGTKSTFVPIGEASREGDDIRVPYEKAQVKDAPRIDPDGTLSTDEEQTLYSHYGMDWNAHDTGSGRFEGGTGTTGTTTDAGFTEGRGDRSDYAEGEVGGPGRDTSGPTTDSAMTRSEEELRVGKQQTESGRARLRKYVVTENVTQTVPVQREELRVEREPITDANVGNATDGPAISEEEHEVVLHEERPVVEKQAVPKERVRLDTETVTEEQTVSEQVRKEQIELDEGGARR